MFAVECCVISLLYYEKKRLIYQKKKKKTYHKPARGLMGTFLVKAHSPAAMMGCHANPLSSLNTSSLGSSISTLLELPYCSTWFCTCLQCANNTLHWPVKFPVRTRPPSCASPEFTNSADAWFRHLHSLWVA